MPTTPYPEMVQCIRSEDGLWGQATKHYPVLSLTLSATNYLRWALFLSEVGVDVFFLCEKRDDFCRVVEEGCSMAIYLFKTVKEKCDTIQCELTLELSQAASKGKVVGIEWEEVEAQAYKMLVL
ncbi:hypothetical protein CDAR_34061 [Caerostris darwini]|uniref:Uncharacterized protein n=1 Tax=Caerostris darwini TaxID=1538125 RepID=A0AAV4RFT0_9ARAC|nr:hypothetical protein CDAR_34061 [Caerostris darwini]